MWRFVAGGVAALFMAAAAMVWFNARAKSDPLLPPQPLAATAPAAQEDAPLPDRMPEASPRSREEKRFDRYDKDRDARITREEYLASRRKAFARLDTNGDGRLSFDEWSVKTSAKFAAADKDRSGTMNRAEFATTAVKRTPRPRCVCPSPAVRDDDGE